jgi:hypothetical protein
VIHLFGVDCAAQAERTGILHARWEPDREPDRKPGPTVDAVIEGASFEALTTRMLEFLPHRSDTASVSEQPQVSPAVLALDAPLGWPARLGTALRGHRAGDRLRHDADHLFRRETDRVVRARVGKQTLDVGADRIARTAVSALGLLDRLRSGPGYGLSALAALTTEEQLLAFRRHARLLPSPAHGGSGGSASVVAEEVYPAGWLHLAGLPSRGYKKASQRQVRRTILSDLETRCALEIDPKWLLADADLLDALICLLCAVDTMEGRCPGPESCGVERGTAEAEGWIWLPLNA